MTDQQAQPLTDEELAKRLRLKGLRLAQRGLPPHEADFDEMHDLASLAADRIDALRLTLARLQEPHIVVIQRDDATSWWISCSCSYATKLKESPEAGQAAAMEIATQHSENVKAAAKAAADE